MTNPWPTPSINASLPTRIRNWWQGYYAPPVIGDIGALRRPLCSCGHGVSVHGRKGCQARARDQWLPWRNLPCRCPNSWRSIGRVDE